MKRFCILLAILALLMCTNIGYSATAATTTNISHSQPTAGYVIHAKTITASASGNTAVVAAVTGKRIKVISYDLIANGSVNVKFQSETNDIDGSPLWYLTQNSGVTKPVTMISNQPVVYLRTNAGESLNINLSASESVSGSVLYYVE